MDKSQWLEENGFDNDENTYCIIGNTFNNKEYFKEQGCKYSPLLKWHTDKNIDIPDDCIIIKINFNDIYEWNNILEKPLLFENAKDLLSRLLNVSSKKEYEFLGYIGQRIYNVSARYEHSNSFISRFGQFTYIHTFKTEKNKIIWFTTKKIELNIDTQVLITGTIVRHQNYKGDNTTVINRCIIKLK